MSRFRIPAPGELRNRVLFQTRTEGKDAAGGVINTWATQFSAGARIDILSGRELLAAQVVNAETTAEIWIRWRPQLRNPVEAARYRIVTEIGSRVFSILASFDPENERHRWLVCRCSEGVIKQESVL